MTPPVLDASGNQLEAGMRANLHGRRGTVGETVLGVLGDDGGRFVYFLPDLVPDPVPCWVSPGTNRALDLKAVLTPDPEEKR